MSRLRATGDAYGGRGRPTVLVIIFLQPIAIEVLAASDNVESDQKFQSYRS